MCSRECRPRHGNWAIQLRATDPAAVPDLSCHKESKIEFDIAGDIVPDTGCRKENVSSFKESF